MSTLWRYLAPLAKLTRMMPRLWVTSLFALSLGTTAPSACAGEATIAVAANFSEVIGHLTSAFENQTPDKLRVVIGSTGSLYAQITHGAPFDVMLAADQRRPRLLEESGGAVAVSRFTYAIGRLTLWSTNPDGVGSDGAKTLADAHFRKLAMANPKLAPYGEAAREVLVTLGLYNKLAPRIVTGANIGQTFTLVETDNADLGFVALSYVVSPRNKTRGSRWDVPQTMYTPIRQDAILIRRAKDNPTARAFLAFLKSPAAIRTIRDFGYEVDSAPTP